MDEEEEEEMRSRQQAKRARRPPDTPAQTREEDNKDKNTIELANKNKSKAVLCVPYTVGSILAKRQREA